MELNCSTHIDITGEVLPCALHTFNLSLASKNTLSSDFKSDSSDFGCEFTQLSHHSIYLANIISTPMESRDPVKYTR